MKNKYIATCWDCEIEIEMNTPDFLSDEVFCYDCAMAKVMA
jgi:hypothetical protein